ncbi:MAG: polysaccharide lyase family protein [Planctomycetota bacterium]|nr:polysaccharide lyase family protein [Planctomycetota bacterium]
MQSSTPEDQNPKNSRGKRKRRTKKQPTKQASNNNHSVSPRALAALGLAGLTAYNQRASATPTVQTASDGGGSYYLVNNGPLQFKLYNGGNTAGKITSINFDGQQMVGSKGIYYDIQGTPGIFLGGGEAYSVKTGANFVDIAAEHPATATEPLDVTWHWILQDGAAGYSTYLTYHHTTAMADYSSNENRVGAEFFNGSLFHYSSITDNFWGYQAAGDPARSQGRFITGETADMRGIPSEYIKNYETKYDWRSNYNQSGGLTGIFGAPNTSNATGVPLANDYGVWNVDDHRSFESWNSGPTHPQTPVADGASIIPSPAAAHFGGPGLLYTGNMDKAFGPIFTYFNKGTGINSLRSDASTYATGTTLDNFYDTLNLPYYASTSQRGAVTGKIRIADGQSLTGATVILSTFNPTTYAADPISQEYQRRAAGYDYWGSANNDGTFSLADVRPGTYRVTVIKPGVYRETTYDNITVTAGTTTNTGNLTWSPDVNGKGVFQIGTFDRTAGEFRDGKNYNNWIDTFNISKEFPAGVNYTVNPSNPFNDTKNWAQNWPLDQINGSSDFYKVNFNLPSAPAANAMVTVTVAIAAQQFMNDLAVLVGGHRVDASVDHTADTAPSVVRSGDTSSKVLYRKLTFPASWLTAGSNSLQFHITGGEMQWDAVRMDITNPGTFSASQWDGSSGNWSDPSHWQTQHYGFTAINKGTLNLTNDTSTTFADGATQTAPINNNAGQLFYDAVINGGAINLDTSAQVQKLSILQGNLNAGAGSPTLTANDIFAWAGGNVSGNMTLSALTDTTVNFNNVVSGGAKINSIGPVTWTDGATVTVSGAGTQWNTTGLSFGQGGPSALTIDTGGLVSTGSGTFTVGTQGIVNIANGTLNTSGIDNSGTFTSAGNVSVGPAGTFNNSGNATINGGLSGKSVTNTAGAMIINGTNTYTGATSITGGVVQFGSASSIGGVGASVIVGPGGAVAFTPGVTNPTFLSRINLTSTGALALTPIDAGTPLDFTSSPLAPLSNMAIGAVGNVNYTGAYAPAGGIYRLGGGGGTLTYTPAITGIANLALGNVGSSGAVVLNNANSFTGPTTIKGVTLYAATLANGGLNSPIGSSSNSAANLVIDGATLAATSNVTTDRLFTLGAGGATLDGSGGAMNFTNPGALAASGIGDRIFTLTGSKTNTFSPGIVDPSSGVTSLIKDGAGTWNLGAGSSTYSGGATVLNGILQFGAGAAVPFGPGKGNFAVGTTGTFEMNGHDLSINGLNDGPAGPITPSNTNGWSSPNGPGGGVLDNAGATHTLSLGNGDASGLFSGVISGGINLVKVGGGTQTLSGDNTFSGTTTINAGTLKIGIGGTPGSFGPGDGGFRGKLGAGNIINNSTLAFDRGYLTTVPNTISGSGNLKQIANAELVLGGANTYTGTTLVGQGIANIGLGGPNDGTGLAYTGDSSINVSVLVNGGLASSIGASSNAASNLILDGGTLYYTGPATSTDRLFTVTQNGGAIYAGGAIDFTNTGPIAMTGVGNRTLSLGGSTASQNTFNAAVGDPAGGGLTSLTKDRGAPWTIGSGSALTYSGDTLMLMGTLTLGPGAALPFGAGKGNLVFGTSTDFSSAFPAKLEMNGNNLNINALIGGLANYSSVDNNSGTKNMTLGNGNATGSFEGKLTGGINVVKVGTGMQTFSGDSSTFSGSVTVSQGILDITGSLPKNSSANVFIAPDPSGTFGNADDVKLVRSTPAAATIDNWGSQETASSFTAPYLSAANIRIGANTTNNPTVAGGETVTMQWRARAASETPGTQKYPPSDITSYGLISDPINLTGMANAGASGGGQSDPFALQLTYDDRNFGAAGSTSEIVNAAAGNIRIDWFNPALHGGQWEQATNGDFNGGTTVLQDFQGSWDSFSSAEGGITDANIANFLGSWGVDPATNTVWAVVDHTGQFAVVPEPSTLAVIVSIGSLPLLRRKKKSGTKRA